MLHLVLLALQEVLEQQDKQEVLAHLEVLDLQEVLELLDLLDKMVVLLFILKV